ncbi:oligosaccharide repeat unit polymerase [Parabacteroides distasonis]|nr:oligosaccharide repeat unit polymerase [Parabacteroides distasonis]
MEMITIVVVIYWLLFLLILKRVRDSISKYLILVYTTYWCVSLALCYINPFGYYDIKNETYFVLLGHVATFVFGYILPSFNKTIDFSKFIRLDVSKILRSRMFLMLYVFCSVFVLILFYRQRALLAVYSMSDLRGDFMDMILDNSGGAFLIYSTIVPCMYHFCLCLTVYMLLFYRKWSCIFMTLIYVVLYSTIGGGRLQFMTIGYYFLGILILANLLQSAKVGFNAKYVISTKLKLLIPCAVIALVVAMSMTTALRNGYSGLSSEAFKEGGKELGNSFCEYSVGPIVAYDLAMTDRNINKNKLHYGAATISGFDYLLFIIFHRFGIKEYSSYHTTTTVLQNEYAKIAPDRGWNYAYTSCMYYYYDFGLIGVLFLPFIFGFIARKFIYQLYSNLNIYTIALFIYITICMYMSVFSGLLQKMYSIIYIVVMILLSSCQKRLLK